jgi:hypothetical protein
MRRVTIPAMAALIVLALFSGNCLSCPQMLALAASQAHHGCCHQQQTAKTDCPAQSLRQFEKAEAESIVPPALVALAAAPIWSPALAIDSLRSTPAQLAPTPPDPLALQSSLRI